MPADFDSGMFVREPAWHGEGFVADRYPADWNEAREWAGLTWEPIEAPTFGFQGFNVDGDVTHNPAQAVTGDYFADDERKRIIRSDTGATLAVRHNQYEIINHTEMGEVVQAILEQDAVKYETAGSIEGGRAVWALAYLDEPITLPGDNSPTFPYLALLNRHDGSAAFRALSTSVRIVCSNTFSAAEMQGEKNSTVFTFHHSAKWRDRIEEAKQTIRGVRESFNTYVEVATDLAGWTISGKQQEIFVQEFIPLPVGDIVSDRVVKNVETARNVLRQILDESITTESLRGTALGLVQAAGEYADHYRGYRSNDAHYKRQLLKPEPLKSKAVALAREVAKA